MTDYDMDFESNSSSSRDSSPASSPLLAPLDSSPPSSHSMSRFSHPFAASAKANKRPPQREKKARYSPEYTSRTYSNAIVPQLSLFSLAGRKRLLARRNVKSLLSRLEHVRVTLIAMERLWDDALRKPFDTAKSILRTQFVTVKTEPAFEVPNSGKERHMLQLYLFGNNIHDLPPELFKLENLTVLSLQMRDMKLLKLQLNPNPFLAEPSFARVPSASRDILSQRRSMTRIFSQYRESAANSSRAITLLCSLKDDNSRTVLSEYYGVPLSDVWNVPENYPSQTSKAWPEAIAGLGRVCKPGAQGPILREARCRAIHMGASHRWVDVGGAVPLRWRGCIETCLAFLDEDARRANALELPPTDASDAMDFDETDAVMAMDLSGFGVDEFDD
ncbi:hypothetical protein DFJ58DRAFT_861895 [Suillus subalutaceus]|uniref:uncharacterized protein n=1 Tax=Suillus subalutaceus TaxID=48586 RepID=UPI001B862827|nr:uncharacterized protein DFJ58DRAFT_861895 [Suillus subalutaceus]KAG1838166.1 hypothetical protein DFJ58DRAFT_861895 [Suillus subalutaceus]